jgi:hypothetical protein
LVTGRNLAHAHRSAVERALLAADLHLGKCTLVQPTIKQMAALLRVSPLLVAAAIQIVSHYERAPAKRTKLASALKANGQAGKPEPVAPRPVTDDLLARWRKMQEASEMRDELVVPAL